MRYYIIELHGKRNCPQADFSLLLYRLGRTLRVQLRITYLPQPFVCTDPDTGHTLARFYVQSQTDQKQLGQICKRFENQFSRDISCTLQTTSDWPPRQTPVLL